MTRASKSQKSDKADKNNPADKGNKNPQATRETVESIAIAVILAFLFRGFVAEAFVIPTGSMAPTLMGRHIDVWRCPECGYRYQTGASDENPPNDQGNRRNDDDPTLVRVTFCPICRFPLELDRENDPNQNSFTGDRILVSKYEYELHDPQRFDVIVFKFPFNAKINYIKRLLGLPNELLRIYHGDIYVGEYLFDVPRELMGGYEDEPDWKGVRDVFQQKKHELSEGSTFELVPERPRTNGQAADAIWVVRDKASQTEMLLRLPEDEELDAQVFSAPRIVRKPPKKQLALLQIVDDTKHLSEHLVQYHWPSRWQDSAKDSGQAIWSEPEPGTYISEASDANWGWLRYRHVYPSDSEWKYMQEHQERPQTIEREQGALISDYYAYNDKATGTKKSVPSHRLAPGENWVGDLAVECEMDVQSERGEIALDLVEAGVHYRCTIDIATGRATLSINDGAMSFVAGQGATLPNRTAETRVQGAGQYKLRFVNADDQLLLWVDGKVVSFDGPTTYIPPPENIPHWSPQDPGDLAPIGIGAHQAVVKLNRIRVLRDVYYVAAANGLNDDRNGGSSIGEILSVFRDPRTWDKTHLFEDRQMAEFVIGPHKYMPMGDNSPQSSDGRLWEYRFDDPVEFRDVSEGPVFDEEQLIGKAMLIYWPHGWWTPVPFFPNFGRMRLIH